MLSLPRVTLVLALATGGLAAFACNGDEVAPPATVSCINYCQTIAKQCTGDDAQFPEGEKDNATCLLFCGKLPLTEGGNGGNNVQCRLTHLTNGLEAQTPAEKHAACARAGISGLCGNSRCDGFCAANLALCGPTLAYPSLQDCLTNCNKFVDAKADDFPGKLIGSTGDTLQCRTYHMILSQNQAGTDTIAKSTHCPHTMEVSPVCKNATPSDGGVDASTSDASADAKSD